MRVEPWVCPLSSLSPCGVCSVPPSGVWLVFFYFQSRGSGYVHKATEACSLCLFFGRAGCFLLALAAWRCVCFASMFCRVRVCVVVLFVLRLFVILQSLANSSLVVGFFFIAVVE